MTVKTVLSLLAAILAIVHAAHWILMPAGDGKVYPVDLDAKPAPRDVEEDDVSFLLYTQSNPTTSERMTIGGALGSFSASRPTRFAIHGWIADESTLSVVRDAWLQAGDYNVIMVDWSGPAGNIIYSIARNDVVAVGELLASFIDYLVQNGADASGMEVAGHSLGAHIAGIAGNRASETIGRIMALDAAAPLFGGTDEADRVDASDAAFVEGIHTSTIGWADPLGHADFYPNGGSVQEGCLLIDIVCSHNRAFDLYAESIISTVGFVSYQCDSWDNYEDGNCNGNTQALMGAPTPSGTTGTFYLSTAGSSPYALG